MAAAGVTCHSRYARGNDGSGSIGGAGVCRNRMLSVAVATTAGDTGLILLAMAGIDRIGVTRESGLPEKPW